MYNLQKNVLFGIKLQCVLRTPRLVLLKWQVYKFRLNGDLFLRNAQESVSGRNSMKNLDLTIFISRYLVLETAGWQKIINIVFFGNDFLFQYFMVALLELDISYKTKRFPFCLL